MNIRQLKKILDKYDDELIVYNLNFIRIGDEAFIPGMKGIGDGVFVPGSHSKIGEIEEEDSISICSKDE